MLPIIGGALLVALIAYYYGNLDASAVLEICAFLALFAAIAHWTPSARAERRARNIIKAEAEKHLETLARKRMQLVRQDDYGTVDSKPWNEEIERFLKSRIYPRLKDRDLARIQRRLSDIATELIEAPARKRHATLAEELAYDESMTPVMFEHYCATVLRRAGWDCDVTKTSGDQGVDVIATKGQD